MILDVAAAFVATTSALSALVDGIRSAKKLTDDVLVLADDMTRKPNVNNESARALAATNIDPDLIEIASESIQNALDRLKREWRDPTATQAGKDDALRNANFVICSELRRVKQLNNGVLPGTDKFHALWASHGCETMK